MMKRLSISPEKFVRILDDVQKNILSSFHGMKESPEKINHLNETIYKLK